MSRFCFDVDGTITAAPSIFAEIMRGLRAIGHEVYPLTGNIIGTCQTPEQYRYDQLKSMGLERGIHYDDVVICEGRDYLDCGEIKGQWCKKHDIAFMVEDSRPFMDSIVRQSPETLVLRMPSCQ